MSLDGKGVEAGRKTIRQVDSNHLHDGERDGDCGGQGGEVMDGGSD